VNKALPLLYKLTTGDNDMTDAKLKAGLLALEAEARTRLREIRLDLGKAIKAEKRATRLGNWENILCERDRISKLLDREFIALGNVKSHAKRIAELEEKGI
jgi:hypothetical protein